ncbi:hypothetical protein KIPB_012382, partial [Kipferlia bialata]
AVFHVQGVGPLVHRKTGLFRTLSRGLRTSADVLGMYGVPNTCSQETLRLVALQVFCDHCHSLLSRARCGTVTHDLSTAQVPDHELYLLRVAQAALAAHGRGGRGNTDYLPQGLL